MPIPICIDCCCECAKKPLRNDNCAGVLSRIRVEKAIVELLPHGHAKVENVAARLHMSSKTLARQLSAERLTFSNVLRELRSTLAHRYLTDRDLSVSQIAWLLGYKELGAFTRAFHHWSGKSPSAARLGA